MILTTGVTGIRRGGCLVVWIPDRILNLQQPTIYLSKQYYLMYAQTMEFLPSGHIVVRYSAKEGNLMSAIILDIFI